MGYTPNEWRPLDVITSEKLNELEKGLTKTSENVVYGSGGAQQSSDGIHSLTYIEKGDALPNHPQVGDTIYMKDGNDFSILEWDGEQWNTRIDPKLSERIQTTLDTAKADTADQISKNNDEIKGTIDEVAQEKIDLAIKDADFNENAQAMADKALADAKANTAQVAQDTLNSANANIADAKKSLTDDLNKEISDRTKAVSDLDTTAQGYADQAKTDAINAATTADGVINKKIDDTASSITTTINQNKTDADGKITTAQSTATQALNQVSTKVSQTDYDKKTGQLQTDLTTTTQTANQAKTDIVSIKQTDTSQDARMTQIESDASGVKTTVSDLSTTQGKQSGDISTLQQRADGFETTVTKVDNLAVGGRNLLLNSAFLNGFNSWGNENNSWTIDSSTYQGNPVIKSPSTTGSGSRIIQRFTNPPASGSKVTVSFNARGNDSNSIILVTLFNTNAVNIPLSSSFSRYTVSFTIPNNFGVPQIYFWNNVAGNNVFLNSIKVDVGNVATDWTPAPEDGEQATAKAQLTADTARTEISNYKTDADGRISKAQSDITQTAKDVTTKVSQSDYDKKTGDLSTSVSKAQQTADSAVTTIGNYKTSNDNRVKATETSIAQNTKDITLRATSTDLDSAKKDYNAQIAQVKVNADSITNQVSSIQTKINSMGQVNQLANTEFNPDYSGWYTKYPNPTAKDVVSTQFTNVGTDGFGSNMVSHKGNGSWIASSGVPVTPGMKLSFSARFFAPKAITSGGTPIGLYIMAYDANGNRTLSNGYNVPVPGLSVSSNTYKLQNVTIPDKSVIAYAIFAWNVTDEVYISQPMLVFGSTVGDYVPGAYNSNDKVALQQITIDGVTNTVSKQGTNIDSVTKRVTTAEGTLSTATNNINGLQSSVTQTSNQIKTEITDRTKGDSNTLQSSKDFTQSSITNYDKGIQTQITQTANGIIAKVDTKTDSDTVLSLLKDNWSIGITDNIGKITSGIVGNASQMSLISKNVTIDSPSTQITGTAWINSAMIQNGSITNANIADAAITSAKIAQLDVAKLTGDTTSFIKSNWASAYGNVSITPTNITLQSYSGTSLMTELDIGNLGMTIKMPGISSFLDSTIINANGMSFQHSGGSYATVGVMDAGFTLEHNQLGGSPMSIRIGDGGASKGGKNSANDMAFAISAAQDNGTAPQLIWAGSRVGKVSSRYRTWNNPQGFILADNIKFSTWDDTASKVEIDDTVNFYNYAPIQVYGQRFTDGTTRTLHLGGKDYGAKWFGFLDGGDQAGFGTDNTNDVIFFMKGKTYSLYTMLGKLGMR